MASSPKKPFNKAGEGAFTFGKDDAATPVNDNDDIPGDDLLEDDEDDFDDTEFEFTDEDGTVYEFHFGLDDTEAPQDALRDLADKALPRTPEVAKALDHREELELISLLTAVTVQEEFKGKISARDLDRLTAAALLIGANNIDEIYDQFSRATTSIADEFIMMNMQEDRDERMEEIRGFSQGAKRLLFCSIIAELNTTADGLAKGYAMAAPREGLLSVARVVAAVADGADAHLVAKTQALFNKVSELSGHDLVMSSDGKLAGPKAKGPKGPKPPQP